MVALLGICLTLRKTDLNLVTGMIYLLKMLLNSNDKKGGRRRGKRRRRKTRHYAKFASSSVYSRDTTCQVNSHDEYGSMKTLVNIQN